MTVCPHSDNCPHVGWTVMRVEWCAHLLTLEHAPGAILEWSHRRCATRTDPSK